MNSRAIAPVASLLEAGVPPGAIAFWWRRPRTELHGRTPREAIGTDMQLVVELAQGDAADLIALGGQA